MSLEIGDYLRIVRMVQQERKSAGRRVSPFVNLSKLSEEVGELAQSFNKDKHRSNMVEEIADVLIVALTQGYFIDLTEKELKEMLLLKLKKALAKARGR